MPGLIGKKIGITSVFSADGKNVPCTVIEAGPCVVTQVKTVETDGYFALQLGFQEKTEKHTNKAEAGRFKAAGVAPQRHLVEFKEFEQEFKLGDVITVDSVFEADSFVSVCFYSLNLSNNTRTCFDNRAWYIFSIGTENGCHSDFFS